MKFKGLHRLLVNTNTAKVTLVTAKGTKFTIEVDLKEDAQTRKAVDQIVALLVQRFEEEL